MNVFEIKYLVRIQSRQLKKIKSCISPMWQQSQVLARRRRDIYYFLYINIFYIFTRTLIEI